MLHDTKDEGLEKLDPVQIVCYVLLGKWPTKPPPLFTYSDRSLSLSESSIAEIFLKRWCDRCNVFSHALSLRE